MATKDDSLTDDLEAFIQAQTAEGGYANAREYADALMRREREITRVRALLLAGRDSGPGELVDEAYWERQRERIRQFDRKKSA